MTAIKPSRGSNQQKPSHVLQTSLRYLRNFDDDDRKLRFHDIFTKNDNYLDRIIAGWFEKHLHFLTTTDCYCEASELERFWSRFWVHFYFMYFASYSILNSMVLLT